MELRVAPSVKKTIERATAISGLAAGDLAYEGARRILEDHECMVLRGEDREAFLKAVSKPPSPAARLVAALRRHRSEVGWAEHRSGSSSAAGTTAACSSRACPRR